MKTKTKIGIISIGIIFILLGTLTGCFDEKDFEEDVDEVLITDAPFGKYWIHSFGEGHGVFLFFNNYSDSNLKETYTIKFMRYGELKTLLISSTDPRLHIIFSNDNSTMELTIKLHTSSERPVYGKEPDIWRHIDSIPNEEDLYVFDTASKWKYYYTFYLTIPKPELCTISDEVVK